MSETTLRQELKERFLQDLTPGEKAFFVRKAREAITLRGYRPSEDLFHYCYFLTLKERLRGISAPRGEGHLRLLLVEGLRDVEEAIRLYRERLERTKLPKADERGEKFLEFFSG